MMWRRIDGVRAGERRLNAVEQARSGQRVDCVEGTRHRRDARKLKAVAW